MEQAEILYRKDRVQCVMGLEHLEEHRLKPESPTRRVVATCCNSAMFLDFTKGHWLSMYRNRFPTGAPPLEMRVMTKDRRASVVLADDVPNYSGFSGKFMLKLLAARIAMGLRARARRLEMLGRDLHLCRVETQPLAGDFEAAPDHPGDRAGAGHALAPRRIVILAAARIADELEHVVVAVGKVPISHSRNRSRTSSGSRSST